MKSELEDLAVQTAIKQLNLKPGKNGEPAVPVGSGERCVEPTPQPKPLKKKKFSIQLDPQMEARAIREAQVKGVSFNDYLQSLVDEKLQSDIGRKLIGGTTWMGGGKKVVSPSNSFGRDI